MRPQLDIRANRAARNYRAREMALRTLWVPGQRLYQFSPRPCFGWRRFVLRGFGANIGAQVNFYSSSRIYFPWKLTVGDWSALGENVLIYNLGMVVVGQKVTISQGAHLCAGTHDHTHPELPLVKSPIRIEDQVWICADAFVGPGVTVGEGAVVGARAVVTKDVAPWTIVAGNPARVIGPRVLQCS